VEQGELVELLLHPQDPGAAQLGLCHLWDFILMIGPLDVGLARFPEEQEGSVNSWVSHQQHGTVWMEPLNDAVKVIADCHPSLYFFVYNPVTDFGKASIFFFP
jgi:hypothetical protein